MIGALQAACTRQERISLKLELDYKLGASLESPDKAGIREINEFMYFDGPRLLGYIGICGFGGPGEPLEITGMVHPEYRRRGIFSVLHGLVTAECARRNTGGALVLCDRESASGRSFINKTGAVYRNSEYEMYLGDRNCEAPAALLRGITLRKAVNSDSGEIARQNAVYFGDIDRLTGSSPEETDRAATVASEVISPEEEEKRGMTIWLAEKDGCIVGKVHVQMSAGAVGGIYGLGVLPEYRGNGNGRAVLLLAVKKLKEAGAKDIMLQVAAKNMTALSLYKSCGFQEMSTMDYYELRV